MMRPENKMLRSGWVWVRLSCNIPGCGGPGDVVALPEKTAAIWIKKGLAAPAERPERKEKHHEEVDDGSNVGA